MRLFGELISGSLGAFRIDFPVDMGRWGALSRPFDDKIFRCLSLYYTLPHVRRMTPLGVPGRACENGIQGVSGMSAQAKLGPAVAAVLLAGLLAGGCSAISDTVKPDAMYGGTPAASAKGTTFPDLRSVPEARPEVASAAEQQQMAEGLAADRDQARYADQLLRSGTGAPASTQRTGPMPPPLPSLDDVPPEVLNGRSSLYEDAPVIPMPTRGGHSDMTAVFKIETAAKAPSADEAAVVTEDGAPAASSGADTGPEVTPAPTKRVDVKPVIGSSPEASQP